ncbi:MAG: hypothetical protein IJ564_00620 [Alphaproteobacteria bacterium]|nr:hypothetical protein [Alphaproteobacteria bacterium]
MRFSELEYSDADLTQDSIHFLKTQVYEPSFMQKVKNFIADDLRDFKRFYDDTEYLYLHIYYDEYVKDYKEENGRKEPLADMDQLGDFLQRRLERFGVDEDDVEEYARSLDSEFKKNAMCTHMEPFFVGEDAVIATVVAGYSQNPMYSVCDMAREWCMAMHFKNMYPVQVRKFGSRYQEIKKNYSGEERLKMLVDFRDKYHRVFKNIGLLRAVHASVFSYAYMFLKAAQSNETDIAEKFIMDNSTYKLTLLLEGEPIKHFDFPVTKYVLDRFHEGKYREFILPSGNINWEGLYKFTFDAISDAGFDGVRTLGFDSIEAKTMRSFWNKSANMQSMLKVLRRLALETNDPLFHRLIEGCEYHLGRKDKTKQKMERFIEETRKIMRARAYELTHPRNMAQDLIAAFPSVFLVHFQWHHNFRNIHPRFLPFDFDHDGIPDHIQLKDKLALQKVIANQNEQTKKYTDELQKMTLSKVLQEQSASQLTVLKYENEQARNLEAENENQNKMREILMNKERTMAQMSMEKTQEQEQNNFALAMQKQNMNSY